MDNEDHLSDGELLARCKQGDNSAWQQLVDRHQHGLRRSVQRQLRSQAKDSQLVEDLVQEVLLGLIEGTYQRLQLYNPGRASFAGFLNALAKQAIQRRRRSRTGHREREVPLEDQEPTGSVGDDGLVQAELAEYLDALTPQERRCLRENLLGIPASLAEPPITPGNERFLRHRLQQKWKEHFEQP